MTETLLIETQSYLATILRRTRFILLCTALASIAGLAVTALLPRVYEAESSLVFVRANTLVSLDSKITTISDVFDLASGADQAARRKGFVSLAKDPEIAAAVIASTTPISSESRPQINAIIDSVEAQLDGDVLKISARSSSPTLAAAIANSWAQEYAHRVNAVYTERPVSAAETAAQADAAKAEYNAKEAALATFIGLSSASELQRQIAEKTAIVDSLKTGGEKSRNYVDSLIDARLVVLDQRAKVKTQQLSDLYAAQLKFSRLLADGLALRQRLSEPDASMSRGADLALTVLEASAFTSWAALPVDLQMPLESAARPGTPAEAIRTLDRVLTALSDRKRGIEGDIQSISLDLVENAGAEARDAQLQALSELTSSALANEPIDKILLGLGQNVNALRSELEKDAATRRELTYSRDLAWTTYSSLAAKASEVAIAESSAGSVVRQVTTALPPEDSTSPRTLLNLGIAGATGLFVALASLLIDQLLHRSLRNKREAAFRLGIPVLAEIASETGAEGTVILAPEPLSGDSRMQSLRRRLSRDLPSRFVLIVTSALPGEGKNTVALGIATAFANSRRPVVLVDADLRNPTLHDVFHLENLQGLSSLLVDNGLGLSECLQESSVAGLRVLPAGPRVDNPSQLFDSPIASQRIADLRSVADVVIVAGPSVLRVPDTSILAPLCDGVLLVISRGRTQLVDVMAAKDDLAENEARIVGAVLSTIPMSAGVDLSDASVPSGGERRLGSSALSAAARVLGLDP